MDSNHGIAYYYTKKSSKCIPPNTDAPKVAFFTLPNFTLFDVFGYRYMGARLRRGSAAMTPFNSEKETKPMKAKSLNEILKGMKAYDWEVRENRHGHRKVYVRFTENRPATTVTVNN